MAFNKTAKPATSFSKTVRPKGAGKTGYFDIGTFGSAKFDETVGDSYTKTAKPPVSFTKQAKT